MRLAELPPAETKVCVVSDHGFGDQKFHRMLTEKLHFDDVIRFRGNIAVTATSGETRADCVTPRSCASAWAWDRCTSNPPSGATGCG